MIGAWFEEGLVTRGTELDPTGTVGMPVFLRYFEHVRWLLMREEVLGLAALVHAGHFFVVRSQTAELRRRIGQGVPLRFQTRLVAVGRSTAEVLHVARKADDGAIVARARVLGVWLGPERRMVRLPDRFREHAWPLDASETPELASGSAAPAHVEAVRGGLPGSFTEPPEVVLAPLSIAVDPPALPAHTPLFEHRIVVPPRDLDLFSHVNAATWLTYADDARLLATARGLLPHDLGTGYVARTALHYGREAIVYDALRVALGPLDGPVSERHALGAWFFRDPDPEPLCAVRVDLAPGARPLTAPDPAVKTG